MAQQVEHVLGKDEVTGSNPVSSSKRKTTVFGGFFVLDKDFGEYFIFNSFTYIIFKNHQLNWWF